MIRRDALSNEEQVPLELKRNGCQGCAWCVLSSVLADIDLAHPCSLAGSSNQN